MNNIVSVRVLLMAVVVAALFTGTALAADPAPFYAASIKEFETRSATADPDNWRFVYLGDNRGNDSKFREILQRAKELEPLFILHGGDIVERGRAEELRHFLELAGSVKGLPPLFVVRGNHEMNAGLFEKMIGPLDFVIDSKRLGLRLVAVDNSSYVLGDRELRFLADALDGSRPTQIVAMHIPPKTERWPRHSFDKGRGELLTLLSKRNVKMGLYAHIHIYDSDLIDGIPSIVSGGAGAQLAWLGYGGEAVYHMVVIESVKGKLSYRVERFETTLIP